ncbi:hypothetical protein CDAR_369411 [Caerostris darwini]|uniref:Uncharacterized protein n=1 Tax=Caerostris darwini TaxID=1538125 RepID=A0AAV4RXL0_9ARAC|nr:hypothetical protein CDAR_369411 [Caerostris darwini]
MALVRSDCRMSRDIRKARIHPILRIVMTLVTKVTSACGIDSVATLSLDVVYLVESRRGLETGYTNPLCHSMQDKTFKKTEVMPGELEPPAKEDNWAIQ